MRLVFAGTPDFAVPTLAALHDAGHDIVAVYTQPDRPAGRGRHLSASPVKHWALEHDLPVRQPASLQDEDEIAALQRLAPDAMVVVAYGLLLPQAVLDIPRYGCFNVHASLLPRWRGAAPIQRAIEAGDARTGVTIMQMDAGLDTGDMLLRRETEITDEDTAASMHDRLARLGAEAMVDTLQHLREGAPVAVPQDSGLATYARKLDKDEAEIDWREPAKAIARRVRAFHPWPGCVTRHAGRRLRILAALALAHRPAAEPGTVVAARSAGIDIATGGGVLRVTRLQPEGGKPLDAAAFLNGHALAVGERLGR